MPKRAKSDPVAKQSVAGSVNPKLKKATKIIYKAFPLVPYKNPKFRWNIKSMLSPMIINNIINNFFFFSNLNYEKYMVESGLFQKPLKGRRKKPYNLQQISALILPNRLFLKDQLKP